MGRADNQHLDVGQMRIGGEAAVVAGNAEEIKRIANPKVDIFSQDYPRSHRGYVGQAQRPHRQKPSHFLRQQRHPGPAVRFHRGLRRAGSEKARPGARDSHRVGFCRISGIRKIVSRAMPKRISALFLFVAFLTITNRAPAQLTSIKIGHNGFTDETVFYLGRDAGIFKKYGIHLELIYIPGGSLSVQALIGNSLDMLLAGGTPLVYAVLKGADLKFIAGLNNRMPYVLVARDGINTAEQLRGKKIGISRFGSNTDFVVKLAATQMGLNPKRDIQIMQVGGPDARVVALKSGIVDATVVPPELVSLGRKLGYHTLFDLVEKEIEYLQIGVAARTDYLKSQNDTARRLTRAYLESIKYYVSHRDEAIKEAMKLLKIDERQAAEVGYEYRLKTLPVDGKLSVKGMQLVIDAAAEDDPKAKSLSPQQLFDLSFLP